jgi:hypothetical protein
LKKILCNPRKVLRDFKFVETFQFLLIRFNIVFSIDVKRVFASSEYLIHDDARGPNVDTLSIFMIIGHDFWGHIDDSPTLFVEAPLYITIFS